MHVSYTALRLNPNAVYCTVLRLALAARKLMKGVATTNQIAALLEAGYFEITDTEALEYPPTIGTLSQLSPAEEINALSSDGALNGCVLFVNRLSGRMFFAAASKEHVHVRHVGNLICTLTVTPDQPQPANDQPPHRIDEGAQNLASYIIGQSVVGLEHSAQDVVRLGQAVEVTSQELISMLLMSVALANQQRLAVEQGQIKPEQALKPKDVFRCIKISSPLSVAV